MSDESTAFDLSVYKSVLKIDNFSHFLLFHLFNIYASFSVVLFVALRDTQASFHPKNKGNVP